MENEVLEKLWTYLIIDLNIKFKITKTNSGVVSSRRRKEKEGERRRVVR